MGAVGVALVIRVVLVDQNALFGRGHRLRALARQVQDALAGAVPDDGVARIRRLGTGVLGMGVVHVEAGAVGQDQVDEARLFLGGALLFLHVLEAPGIPQRTLCLVVPSHARAAIGLVGVDQQQGGQDRVEVRLILDRDPVLGLDAHDFRDGHAVPSNEAVRKKKPGPSAARGGKRGGRTPAPSSNGSGRSPPPRSTGIVRCSQLVRRSAFPSGSRP